jgi:hypothetical protein
MDNFGYFPGDKFAGIKNTWSRNSTPKTRLHALCLIKQWIHLYGMVLGQQQGQLYF